MSGKPLLRPAAARDALSIIDLARVFVTEIAEMGPKTATGKDLAREDAVPVNDLVALQNITTWLSNPNAYRLWVAADAERVVACHGLRVSTWWVNNQIMLHDLWTYVLPDYRSMSMFRQIVDAGAGWAKEIKRAQNAPVQLVHGHMNGVDLDRKVALYKRFGFAVMGGNFLLEV